MKRPKKGMSPVLIGVMFITACGLLVGSSISGTRAALTYYSDTYTSRVQMFDIGVSLWENNENIAWRNYNSAGNGSWNEQRGTLLANMVPEGELLKIGAIYPEELKVCNTGTINQYIRVSIYKYWTDAEGNRLTYLSPDLIDLHLTNLDTDWILDEEASTPERTVLYYRHLLYASENENQGASETSLFADTLTIDKSLLQKVTQEKTINGNVTNITTSYDYDGVQFWVEAQVDAVQEHNAEDAAWSAWGRRLYVRDGSLNIGE